MLKARLYEHARSLGIVGPEASIGELPRAEDSVVEIESYRKKKGANG
jgi:hypothetical protein